MKANNEKKEEDLFKEVNTISSLFKPIYAQLMILSPSQYFHVENCLQS